LLFYNKYKTGVKYLPNIKSAKKRVDVIEKKTLRNKTIKSALKTQLKKFDTAVAANEGTDEIFKTTVSSVDAACSKGTIHKNKANRIKAQLAKKAAQ